MLTVNYHKYLKDKDEYLFPSYFCRYGLFFLFIGFGVMLRKKPMLINYRYFFALLVLAISSHFFLMASEMIGEKPFNLGMPAYFISAMYIILLGYFWIEMKGYMVIGISDESFRNALHSSLRKNSLGFEERLSIINLTELNVDIQVAIQSWVGVGQLRCKKSKDSYLLPKIVSGINDYYRENSVTPNNITSVFYITMGVLTLVFSSTFYFVFELH